MEQPTSVNNLKIHLSTTLLLTIWLIACIQINTAYKSKLSSLMIHPPEKQIHNFKELMLNGYKIIVNKKSSDEMLEILSTTYKLDMTNRFILWSDGFCKGIDYIRKHKAAIVGEITELSHHSKRLCRDVFRHGEEFKIINTPIRSCALGWAFKVGAPYWPKINIEIQKITEVYGSFNKPRQKNNNRENQINERAVLQAGFSSLFLSSWLPVFERQLVAEEIAVQWRAVMAAFCPGVQYGLSSQQNFGENKDLIFVKLTDSALRAIEEFLRNQNKFSQTPTIKFLGNENGELSFPSIHHQGGSTSFSFSMSSTADMEGPGGSFECIQQMGSPRGSLEGLGSIPYKIRVHANEDVYEVTRTRMTEAEDKYKNKCTREIKPNQTDIGRKVKVKQTQGRMQPIPPVRREMPSMRESLMKQQTPYQTTQSKPSAMMMAGSNGLSNGLGSNHVSSSRPLLNKPSVPDIARRPLKERLIHLLALRPFKKVELYERLNKEGLREKNGMTSVLKQISYMKDNCYHLHRAMWNEVQDDWQFYTESEKQMLKRRKPQNLTPPGSDGGSSGSGQSPTSTHPGSPPPPPSIGSSKRPGVLDAGDGMPPKRQRISHYRKPPPEQQYRPPMESNSQRRPATDSRDASNMNPRSRESPTNGYLGSVNGYGNGMLNEKRNLSDDEEGATKKRSCDSHSLSFGVNREKTFLNGRGPSPAKAPDDVRKDAMSNDRNGPPNGRIRPDEREKERNKYSNKVTSSTQNRIARVSPDSQTEILAADLEPPPPIKPEKKIEVPEFPDYVSQYTTIKNIDQRRRYKADFNADYAEYRDLHGVVEKVSRKFAQLEERLKQEDESSPEYKDIKNQIIKEYHENKKDLEHQKAKRRFNYLHDKLSHIKRLVFDYDQNMRQHSQY